jgi:formylglycine-generating enzyme required for sulfatase activity
MSSIKKILVISFFIALVITICGCRVTKLFGTRLNESDTYFDQTEVDVRSWLSYYTWTLENEGEKKAAEILPDSSAIEPALWKLIKNKTSIYSNSLGTFTFKPLGYFRDDCNGFIIRNDTSCFSNCLYHPITGITFEQAVNFCKWRTKIINENEMFSSDKSTVTFRLPTEEEWTNFAKRGLAEVELKNGSRDSTVIPKKKNSSCKNCPVYNYKILNSCGNWPNSQILNVGSFVPDKNGFYDTFGSISEMTSKKGIAKGGNFMLFASQCSPDSIQIYNKPEKWLGFRCIAIKSKY